MTSQRHIEISQWLQVLGLQEYQQLFQAYRGVEELIYCTEASIRHLGVTHGGHRAKIVSSLNILRDKYEKGNPRDRVENPTHLTSKPGPPIHRPSLSVPRPPIHRPSLSDTRGNSLESIQQELQKELSADASKLSSRSWYHGAVSRQQAEALVRFDGDFLVRDSVSQPGNLVLTVRWTGAPLSFVINQVSVNQGFHTQVNYQFEEEAFSSVQELIYFYRSRVKPVTLASGAYLKNGVPRSVPLSFYSSAPRPHNISEAIYAPSHIQPHLQRNVSFAGVGSEPPAGSPDMHSRWLRWTGSQPALSISSPTPGHLTDGRNSLTSLERSDSVPVISITSSNSIHNNNHQEIKSNNSPQNLGQYRSGSAPILNPADLPSDSLHKRRQTGIFPPPEAGSKVKSSSSDSNLTSPPPPKPSRIPSVKYLTKPVVVVRNFDEDDDDRDYSDYSQVKEEPSWLKKQESRFHVSDTKEPEVSGSSTPPQRGRRAARLAASNKKQIPIPALETSKSCNMLSDSRCSQSFSPGTRFSTGFPIVPPSEQTQPDPQTLLPTNQRLARRLSERVPEDEASPSHSPNYETPNTNWFNSLPLRSSKKKKKSAMSNLAKEPPLYSAENASLRENLYSQSGRASMMLSADRDFNSHQREFLRSRSITTPMVNDSSAIQPESFTSDLLPKGHKALDQSVLLKVKSLLLEQTPTALAQTLTMYDLQLMKVSDKADLGLGVTSGLELLTLPSGQRLRQDVLERWQCVRLFVSLTLLTCQLLSERAQLLSLWIETALNLKVTLGNLFSFSAVTSALTSAPVARLTDTFSVLRQKYTSAAYTFDTKLRPGLISLNNGTSDLPLIDVSVPHVVPVCELMEEITPAGQQVGASWGAGLDTLTSMDVLLVHLDTARVIASQTAGYRELAATVTSDTSTSPELTHALCPEFHLLLMWGSAGWGVGRWERVSKLEQIYSLLSYKHQVPGDDGTEV